MLWHDSKIVFFLGLILYAADHSYSLLQCPDGCSCYPIGEGGGVEPAAGYRTNCMGLQLRSVPSDVSPNTTELDLGQNYLTTIGLAELAELVNLEILRLDANYIQELSPGVFQKQTKLKQLYLQNNYFLGSLQFGVFQGLGALEIVHLYNSAIDTIHDGVFDELFSIETIELSYNNLVTLPQALFKSLQNLRSLTISNNILVSIGNEVFCNLPALTYLNLRSNHLSVIHEQSVCDLPSLRSFILLNNRISCDCGIIWLYDILLVKGIHGPVCASPKELNGRNLLDLEQREFCGIPRPTLFPNTTDTVLLQGTSITLTCNTTVALPVPIISWTRDNNKIETNGVDIIQSGNTLIISSLRPKDTGVYQCITSSSAGAATDTITITVIDIEQEKFLSSLTRSSNTNVRVPCSVYSSIIVGVPVVWTYNSLPTNSSRHLVLDNGDIFIAGTLLIDSGDYVCRIGNVSLMRRLIVEEPCHIVEFPVTTCIDGSLVLVSSSPTRLTCSAIGNPLPLVQWYHNFVPLTSEGNGLQEAFTVSATHEIQAPSLSDEGQYTCFSQNNLGESIREVTVEVKVLDTTNCSVIPIMGVAGSVLSLPCEISNSDSPPTWTKNDGGSISVSSITAIDGSLFFGNAMLIDTGIYLCTIDISSAKKTVQYNVTILALPEILTVDKLLPEIFHVLINETVSLTCNVTSSLVVVITWLYNGQEIDDNNIGNNTFQILEGGSTLVLHQVKGQQEGLYKCQAENSLGNATWTYLLEVLRPPSFLTVPTNVAVDEGETAVLSCSSDGNPLPVITWWMYHNDVPIRIETSARIIISIEYLTIISAVDTDSGRYFCALNSTLGTITSDDVFLNVWTPPVLADNLPTEYFIAEGMPVSLLCFASADPVPAVRWFKNGTRLPISGQHTQNRSGLNILYPTREDEGKYVCRVINIAGMVDLDVFLSVLTYPSVSVSPLSVTSFVDCMILLSCVDNKTIPNNFTWSHKGTVLANTSRVTVRSNGELLITRLHLEDSGLYVCTVYTELGIDTANASILILEPFHDNSGDEPTHSTQQVPAIVTFTPMYLDVNLNTTLQLVCTPRGIPLPTIRWEKDNIILTNDLTGITIQDGLLIIETVSSYDSGVYKCEATNILGSAQETFIVNVNSPPLFVTLLQSVTVTVNETIFIDCVVMGQPSPAIRWLFEGLVLISNNRVMISDNNTLVIVNSTVSDSGLYSCVGSNVAGTSTSTFPIVVTGQLPDPPSLSITPINQIITVGEPFTLTCSVSKHSNITWLLNGSLVSLSSTRLIINTSSLTSSLSVSSATVSDNGVYTCTAVNAVGTTSHTVHVDIRETTEAPAFTLFPPLQLVMSPFANITLSCQASGKPTPIITWLKDEQDVAESGELRYSVLSNGSLLIVRSMMQDSGNYICTATNKAGTTRTCVNLQINSDTPTLSFHQTPQDQLVLTRSSVVLSCITEGGDPSPVVFWAHNDDALIDSKETSIVNDSLIIREVSLKHDGVYTCYATNGLMTITADAELVVEERKEPPYFIHKPTDTDLLKGELLLLYCKTTGPGTVKQTWLINGYLISDENNGVIILENGTKLLIATVNKHDSGSYTCLSENEYGLSEWTAYVQVYSYRSNNSLVHTTGSSIQLICKTTSTTPQQWFKDGTTIDNSASVNVFVINNDLWIFGMTVTNTGEYTCGITKKEVYHLKVQVPPYIKEQVTAPLTVVNDTKVMLNCTVQGVPTPTITWQYDTQKLYLSNKYSLYSNGSLVIRKTLFSDSGQYICIAENAAGRAQLIYNVII